MAPSWRSSVRYASARTRPMPPSSASASSAPRPEFCPPSLLSMGCDGEPLIAAEVEARVVTLLAALPSSFSEGHRQEGKRSARIWDLLMRVNQRRALGGLFSFLAWDPTSSRFVAEPSELEVDLVDAVEPPPVASRPPPPMTLRELFARDDRRE